MNEYDRCLGCGLVFRPWKLKEGHCDPCFDQLQEKQATTFIKALDPEVFWLEELYREEWE